MQVAAQPAPFKEKILRCDGEGEFCVAMSSRLEDGHKKGLNAAIMMNWKTGKELDPVILYKSSASDKGLILNYCPWCGKPLNRRVLNEHYRLTSSQGEPDGTPPQANPELVSGSRIQEGKDA